MLTAALGISSSSLYAAFGTKGDLFAEAVRTYAHRYSDAYARAVREPILPRVIERLLVDSAHEFTRSDDGHPGCLTSSAVMADASASLDVRAYVAELQRDDERRLVTRIARAVTDRQVHPDTDPVAIAALVQTIWHGLSARAELGATRDELIGVATHSATLISYGLDTNGITLTR